jgi:hypothetical protein
MAPVPSEIEAVSGVAATASTTLLVMITPVSQESLELVLGNLSSAFASGDVLVAASDVSEDATAEFGQRYPNLHLLTDSPSIAPAGGWVLTAADFLNAYKIVQQHGASGCLLLGPESQSLTVEALLALATAVANDVDLVVPRYAAGPREGLVNSAMLYPVNRAIFGARARFPLAIDLGLSIRMASRLATIAQKYTALNQNDALIWPVAEAAVAGYLILEVETGVRTLPQPTVVDLNTLLGHFSASLFAEVETHAAFWQRVRVSPPSSRAGMQAIVAENTFPDSRADVLSMIESFQLAYKNLQEIWSLVLPPNSLLGLKRLSQMPVETFRMGDSLWARTVYDFILAYRLRTINRGHLLGALTPLYLAWVASHILLAQGGVDPERHVEEVALAFETDKAYLVSRWRWPDRFNP